MLAQTLARELQLTSGMGNPQKETAQRSAATVRQSQARQIVPQTRRMLDKRNGIRSNMVIIFLYEEPKAICRDRTLEGKEKEMDG
jgi:hypothetical protein